MKTFLFNALENGPHAALANGVGLDEGEGLFHGKAFPDS
jgi:hypothetical protein